MPAPTAVVDETSTWLHRGLILLLSGAIAYPWFVGGGWELLGSRLQHLILPTNTQEFQCQLLAGVQLFDA